MVTYEELVEDLRNTKAVIKCNTFAERRAAVKLLHDMGFEFGNSVLNHIDRSEEIGDMTFMNPGIDERGVITCYKASYDMPEFITYSEVKRIFDEYNRDIEDMDDSEFDERVKALLFGG